MNATNTGDEQFVTQLLDESGVSASEPLQDALLELRASSNGPVTAPSGELAALMAPNVTALRPRRKARKAATVGIAVVAATGLSVSGVAAASPEFRDAANDAVQQVVQFFDATPEESRSGSTGQAPAPGQDTDRTSGDGEHPQPVPGSTATSVPDEASPAQPREHTGNGSERAPARDVPADAVDWADETPWWNSPQGDLAPRDSGPGHLDLPRVPDLPTQPGIPTQPGGGDGGDGGGDGGKDQQGLVPKPIAPQPSDAPNAPVPAPDVPGPAEIPAPSDDPANIPRLPELKTPSP